MESRLEKFLCAEVTNQGSNVLQGWTAASVQQHSMSLVHDHLLSQCLCEPDIHKQSLAGNGSQQP